MGRATRDATVGSAGLSVQASLPGRKLQAAGHVEKKRKQLMEERETEQLFGSGASRQGDMLKHPFLSLQKARLYRSSLFRLQLDRLAKAARGEAPARLLAGGAQPQRSREEAGESDEEEGASGQAERRKGKKRKLQKKAVGSAWRVDESEETQAIAAFLMYLRTMLNAAPARDVSFDRKRKEKGRREAPLLPLLAPESPALQHGGEVAGFRFEAPTDVKVVGGFPLGLMSSFDKNIEVAVEMPAHMFQPKDYLNYRYLTKRSAYVEQMYRHVCASLAGHFPSLSSAGAAPRADAVAEAARAFRQLAPLALPRAALQLCGGEPAKPLLVVRFASPLGGGGGQSGGSPTKAAFADLRAWTVKILFVPPPALFKVHMLAPQRNCVRAPTTCLAAAAGEIEEGAPTPYYNGLVLEDLRLHARHATLHRCCADFGEAFRDAVQLLKLWANRRGRGLLALPPARDSLANAVAATGLDESTLALLCAHACASNRDVAAASPQHLFVLTLAFLAHADFLNCYYVFGNSRAFPRAGVRAQSDGAAPAARAASAPKGKAEAIGRLALAPGLVADALLFDGEDCVHNLLWRVQLHVAELQQLAQGSLQAVETLEDPFDALFGVVRTAAASRGPTAAEAAAGAIDSGLLLENDVHLFIPHAPSAAATRAALRPEASIPLHDYAPAAVRATAASESGELPQGAMPASSASERDALRALDEGAKWESPSLQLLAASLARVLLRALGDRVQGMQIRFTLPTFRALAARKLGKTADDAENEAEEAFGNVPLAWREGLQEAALEGGLTPGVFVSLRLNAATAARTLDRGPAAAAAGTVSEAVESFKAFWGAEKVELRRFQDAQILYTVLWRGDQRAHVSTKSAGASGAFFSRTAALQPAAGGRAPPHIEIISYALRRHFASLLHLRGAGACAEGGEGEGKEGSGGDGGDCADTPRRVPCWIQSSPCDAAGAVSPKERDAHRRLVQAFSELRNTICSLSSVPLTVKQARATSPALRYLDIPLALASLEGPADQDGGQVHPVVIEFESSSGWPEDPQAIQKIKTAFLLAMRSELLADYSITSSATEDFLDVEVSSFRFRISIFHPAEVAAAGAVYGDPTSDPLSRHLKTLPERLVAVSERTASSLRAEEEAGSAGVSAASADISPERQGDAKKVAEILALVAADDDDGSVGGKQPLDALGLALLSGRESEAKMLMAAEIQKLRHLRQLWWEPQIAGVLQACAMRFPPFGGSVLLIWRWLGDVQVPGLLRVAEHIAAALFVDYLRQGFAAPPQSPQVAFLRFLHLVANFEWRSRPFRVCFDGSAPLNAEQERLSDASFDRFRLYPTIHSVFDPHGFLIPTPEAAIFDRFVHSARSALFRVAGTQTRPAATADAWREIFTPDLRSFDFILSLADPLKAGAAASGKSAASRRRYANAGAFHETDSAMSLCGLETHACRRRYVFLRLLAQLRETYSDALVLAYNPLAATLAAGGMPAFLAVKIRPGSLCLRRAQPAALLPSCGLQTLKAQQPRRGGRLASQDEADESSEGSKARPGKETLDSDSFGLTVNPVLLMGSLMSTAHGFVEAVHLSS
ncbi:hypothetical protein BESB_022420 [Besnoitia besnoiti]|uniref:Nrap protein n=1 Tax=Besnoitia besnoiti TaxID=94643 RepID=A0A2A9M8N2_BESBE|nr:hypothetical protein BESB_022420 [Besnoitia besnoiti]PFH31750.1 hypothetical protein BESB_022420 [Besnoitia besnoiti]